MCDACGTVDCPCFVAGMRVDRYDPELGRRIEVAARAALAAWDEATFVRLREVLVATVGGTDQPSAGGGDPNAGK